MKLFHAKYKVLHKLTKKIYEMSFIVSASKTGDVPEIIRAEYDLSGIRVDNAEIMQIRPSAICIKSTGPKPKRA